MKVTVMSFEIYGKLLEVLAQKCKNGYFDCIFTIPRGGLPIAVYLSHNLGDGDIPIEIDCKKLKNYRDILIVDEIVDTGKTLNNLFDNIKHLVQDPNINITTAAMHSKREPRAQFVPDIVAEYVEDDRWIIYPYENEAKVLEEVKRFHKSRKLKENIDDVIIFEKI